MDIALTASTANSETGHPSRGIVLHPLVGEALVFACRSDHPLSGRPDVSVSETQASGPEQALGHSLVDG